MTGRTIGAAECHRIGAANRIAPAAELEQRDAGAGGRAARRIAARGGLREARRRRRREADARGILEQEVSFQQILVGDRRLPRGGRRLHGEAAAELHRRASRRYEAGARGRDGVHSRRRPESDWRKARRPAAPRPRAGTPRPGTWPTSGWRPAARRAGPPRPAPPSGGGRRRARGRARPASRQARCRSGPRPGRRSVRRGCPGAPTPTSASPARTGTTARRPCRQGRPALRARPRPQRRLP